MTNGVVLLMGVSGSGKSTIGHLLAERLDWDFLDGDDFHPPENIAKMAQGIPLNDDDRWPWLNRIRQAIEQRLETQQGAVFACSALKHSYQERLIDGLDGVCLVYLRGSFELIEERLRQRQSHFMPTALLRSQFDALEEPGDALIVEIGLSPDEIVREIVDVVKARTTTPTPR